MELVERKDNRIFATSLVIAEKFGKNHAHVLRDIKNLECSKEFRLRNFVGSSYHRLQNKERHSFCVILIGLRAT